MSLTVPGGSASATCSFVSEKAYFQPDILPSYACVETKRDEAWQGAKNRYNQEGMNIALEQVSGTY